VQSGGVGAGQGPVPGVGGAGAGGHLAARAGLVPAVAVQAEAGGQVMLQLEKIEVTYHRVITAIQGVTLEVPKGAIVALLGTNGAGKTTTLRAISGFIGLDDARVTDGAISFRGDRIENRADRKSTRLNSSH